MTNFEREKQKIAEITSEHDELAKIDGMLKKCSEVDDCNTCDFNGSGMGCIIKMLQWLLEDDGTPSAERLAGQNEAWELARKIAVDPPEGFTLKERVEIFGEEFYIDNVFNDNTYAEAAEKVKKWENGKRIKRGDVVRTKTDPDDCGDMVVLGDYNGFEKNIRVMYGDFCTRVFSESDLIKTGRTLPVEDWLKQIGGHDE